MISSKFSLPFLILGTLVLQACSSGVEDSNNTVDNSAFELSQIELVSSDVRAENPNWPDLKTKGLFSFKTCITDKAYLTTIAGERFTVSSSTQVSQKPTDTKGCITWDEVIQFNYIDDEKFFEITGSVQGGKNIKGSRNFKISVNPWAKTAVDQSFGNVDSLTKDLKAITADLGDRLAVTSATLSVIRNQFLSNQTELDIEVITKPMLIRRDLTGALIRENFNAGRFKLDYYLITKTIASNNRRIISQVSTEGKISQNGILKTPVRFTIQEGIDPNDVIEIALKISAIDTPYNLGSDEGLIPMRQLSGTTSTELIKLPEDIATLVNQNSHKELATTSTNDFGFIIDTISIRPGSEGGENLGGSEERSVDAIITACIVDSLLKDSVRNYPFEVSLKDANGKVLVESVETSHLTTGCVEFRASIPFRRYGDQKWNNYTVEVRGTEREPFSTDIAKSRLVYINPWIKSSDFGIDSKVGTPPKVTASTKPRIYIPSFNYNFLGNSQSGVKVNKAMDLLFSRSYMVELNPMVHINHRFDGDSIGQEPLMTGDYRFRLLILAPKAGTNIDFTSEINLNDYDTLTAFEKNVSAEVGSIRTRVDLPLLFTDLIPFSFRNIALIELTPLQKGTSLQSGYFVGIFNGTRNQDSVGTSLESKKDLSTKNVDISRTLTSRIQTVRNNKLAADSVIPNNKPNFAALFASSEQKVTTINHSTNSLQASKLVTLAYDSEASLKTGQGMSASLGDLSGIITSNSYLNDVLRKDICHILYNKNLVTTNFKKVAGYHPNGSIVIKGFDYDRCLASFNDHVDFKRFHHVLGITGQPKGMETDAGNLNRSQAIYYSEGSSVSSSNGFREGDFVSNSVGFGASLSPIPKLFFVSADFSHRQGNEKVLYTMNSVDKSSANGQRSDVSSSQTFAFDKFTVNLQARINKCLLISAKVVKSEIPPIPKTFLPGTPKATQFDVTSSKRIYVCKSVNEVQSYNESYYFIKSSNGGNFNDSNDQKGKLVAIIRGQKSFQEFKTKIIDSELPLMITGYTDPNLANRLKAQLTQQGSGQNFKTRVDFTFPALIEQ